MRAKQLYTTASAIPGAKGEQCLLVSTIHADREGDRIIPEGGDFTNFLKSPVLMWAHGGIEGYSAVPIGTVTALDVERGKGIRARFRFLENDPFADRIRNAWDQGVVRASSIGFKPINMEPNPFGGMDHERWELLELSLCAIPMNPEAVRTLKSFGLINFERTPTMTRNDELIVRDDDGSIWFNGTCRELARQVAPAVVSAVVTGLVDQALRRAIADAQGKVV